MENNSAAIECLIVFYINMKNVLKTKRLIDRVFIHQMVKHCKESGFNYYSDEEIKKSWKNLVDKYMDLKNNGTAEDKENWKYFEILDSCYEPSDFHNGLYPKFSEEMVWFLIECFLKRKTLRKTQEHKNTVAEIQKEFMQCGYLFITKDDIKNKWKSLNQKYKKLKDDPESLRKIPYLQALQGFHEENTQHIAKMIFTRELTEILIERFTEKKIRCVIHGYDSDQVLSEIKSEFQDLGFYFSKEDIKEKWRKLSNIYKFLLAKEKNISTWTYFNAMKNHFKDDFLFPWGHLNNKKINKQHGKKHRLMRERSKSIGAELSRKDLNKSQMLKQTASSKTELRDGVNKSIKRFTECDIRNTLHKKLKTYSRIKQENVVPSVSDNCKNIKQVPNKNSDNVQQIEDKLFKESSYVNRLSTERSHQERRDCSNVGSSTNKVHIININHSDIDRENGNLTINLPSITKKFSDNEFLPLKKRLRVDDDNSEELSDASKEIQNDFPVSDCTELQKHLSDVNENKRLTEEDIVEIRERMNKESSHNYETNNKLSKSSRYYALDEFDNFTRNTYNNFNQHCLIIPKEEQQDNLPMQNYTNPSMAQPPVLLLVIKVNGSHCNSNVLKDSSLKTGGSSNSQLLNREDEKTNVLSDKQENERSGSLAHISSEFVKPDVAVIGKEKESVISEINYNSETLSDSVNNSSTHIPDFDNDNNPTEDEELPVHGLSLNDDCKDIHMEIGDVCGVAENVTVYTTEEEQSEQHGNINKTCEEQKPEEIVFHKPLAVVKKVNSAAKLKMLNKTSDSLNNGSKVMPQTTNYLTNTGKIRLPVKAGGKLKEIFISPRELNKLTKLKPEKFKTTDISIEKSRVTTVSNNTTESANNSLSEFEFTSQTVKPVTTENTPEENSSKFLSITNFLQGKNVKKEEFENESVFSEAIGDDEGLKDNLLATVVDFQEQNNQEFIEIKNLMKQNNLLQRETNRLLRLILEKQ